MNSIVHKALTEFLEYLFNRNSFVCGMLIDKNQGAVFAARVEKTGDELGVNLAQYRGGGKRILGEGGFGRRIVCRVMACVVMGVIVGCGIVSSFEQPVQKWCGSMRVGGTEWHDASIQILSLSAGAHTIRCVDLL
jgi:hypothetical protein